MFASRVVVTVACLLVWRILATIPIPFVIFIGPVRDSSSVAAIGLSQLLNAFIILWVLQLLFRPVRRVWLDDTDRLIALGGLTTLLTLITAYGLAILFEHQGIVRPGGTPLVIASLSLGTVLVFALGVVIDRFGVPNGYGIWFLYGLVSVYRMSQQIVAFIQSEGGDPSMPMILLVYTVVTLLLVASAVLVRDLFVGGVIPPIVIAGYLNRLPLLLIGFVTGSSAMAILSWRATGPSVLEDIAFNLFSSLALFVGCFFTMLVTVGRSRLRSSLTPTTISAFWLILVIVLVPFFYQLLRRPFAPVLPLGGGGFAITVMILVESARRIREELPLPGGSPSPSRQPAPANP